MTSIIRGITCSDYHRHACCDSIPYCDIVRVAFALATQTHTHYRWTFTRGDHPIHSFRDPRCVPRRVQHLDRVNSRLLRYAKGRASNRACAVRAMAMCVRRTGRLTKPAKLKCA